MINQIKHNFRYFRFKSDERTKMDLETWRLWVSDFVYIYDGTIFAIPLTEIKEIEFYDKRKVQNGKQGAAKTT